jgi:hypothetical protein
MHVMGAAAVAEVRAFDRHLVIGGADAVPRFWNDAPFAGRVDVFRLSWVQAVLAAPVLARPEP